MFQKYLYQCTDKVIQALNIGTMEMANLKQSHFTPEYILLGLLEQDDSVTQEVFKDLYDNPNSIRDKMIEHIYNQVSTYQTVPKGMITNITISPEVEESFKYALEKAYEFSDKYIGSDIMFLALSSNNAPSTKSIMDEYGIRYAELEDVIKKIRGGRKIEDRDSETNLGILQDYTIDITQRARNGELDPVIGRDDEIDKLIRIISRRTKNNPILIGEPGVGKTVIVEGLANMIVDAMVPQTLLNKRVLSLNIAKVVAGAKFKGEFEERMDAIIKEVISLSGRIILFIDEIHTVLSANTGGVEASNILKPPLAQGKLQCVGATTLSEYKKFFEKDRALERRFQPILIREPSIKQTIMILKGLKSRYEKYHEVVYTDESLDASASMSARYLTDRFLPDKAIDLLDESGARKHITLINIPQEIRVLEKKRQAIITKQGKTFSEQKFEEMANLQQQLIMIDEELNPKKEKWQNDLKNMNNFVTNDDIAELVSNLTGIPVSRMVETETDKLSHMEENIHLRVIGQNNPVKAVSNAIRRNRAGLKDPDKPIGSFLFLGPTGVGKTELAKALAEFLLDDEARIIRLDMSEYMERHEVSKIIGSPPGYVGFEEGGQLTERVRRNPYSIILLDELEKAHPDIFNILLQILDEGRLTDSHGITVNFRNTIIIGTSNLGTQNIFEKQGIGFGDDTSDTTYETIRRKVLDEVKKFFKPEFLNRLDDIIVFHPLEMQHLVKIVDLFINELKDKLKKKNINLEISKEVCEYFAKEGYSLQYGARPLKRVIETRLENMLSIKIINNEFKNGDKIIVRLDNEQLVLEKEGLSDSKEMYVTV